MFLKSYFIIMVLCNNFMNLGYVLLKKIINVRLTFCVRVSQSTAWLLAAFCQNALTGEDGH